MLHLTINVSRAFRLLLKALFDFFVIMPPSHHFDDPPTKENGQNIVKKKKASEEQKVLKHGGKVKMEGTALAVQAPPPRSTNLKSFQSAPNPPEVEAAVTNPFYKMSASYLPRRTHTPGGSSAAASRRRSVEGTAARPALRGTGRPRAVLPGGATPGARPPPDQHPPEREQQPTPPIIIF